MKKTSPKVFKIAETRIIEEGMKDWLKHLGGESWLDHAEGSDTEKLVEAAGRRCYLSFKEGLNANVTKVRKLSSDYHTNVLTVGHGSVLEHACVTFAFEGVSRVFTHELVRHRAGCAMSQESLRFVRLTDLGFWVPGIIQEYGEETALKAVEIFEKTIGNLENVQHELTELFGIEKEGMPFAEKKKLTSMFRRLAPIGLSTGIVFTANLRAWRHILEMRCSAAAEEEIQMAMIEVAKILQRDYPMIFGDFYEAEENGTLVMKPEFSKV